MTPNAPAPEAPSGPDDRGPRVTSDQMRDLGRLRRTRDRKVAGVAGGVARHLDIDPVIPRVAFVVLALFGGAGLLLYGVCWLIVPVEGEAQATVRLDERSRTVALLVAGGLSALALLGDSLGGWDFPWPLAVIGVVVLVVVLARGREPKQHPGPLPGSPYAATSAWPGPTGPTDPTGPAYAPDPPPSRGPLLFGYTVALLAIALGVLGMVDLAGAPVLDSAYPALALGVCAAMLLVGSVWGRPGGIIALGLLATVATAGATAAQEVDAGQIDVAPTTASAVQDAYSLTAGEIRLDLSRVTDLDALDGRTVDLDVHLGRVVVVVPPGLDVDVDARVDVGERSLFGDRSGMSGQTSLDGGPDAPTLTVDAQVGLGDITFVTTGASR